MNTEAHWEKVNMEPELVKELFRQMDGRNDLPATKMWEECSTMSVMFIKTDGVLELYVHNTGFRQENIKENGG